MSTKNVQNNIDTPSQIVQLNQQTEEKKNLLQAIIKSDSNTFHKLINDDPTLVDCPIPIGYNHFNIYQIIVHRSTDIFIDNVFTKYFSITDKSTDGGKILVPVACERGDEQILKLILKYFPCASLDGISSPNQAHTYLLHDEPGHLIQCEIEAYENETPLTCIIRNDRSDLLSILFQFESFKLNYLTEQHKNHLFYLCLSDRPDKATVDTYNPRWAQNLLRTAGSIKCLKFIIESAGFNPFNIISSKSPFQVILKPIYVALRYMTGQIYTRGVQIPVENPDNISLLFYDLINKQMELFRYLITHCCLQPRKSHLNLLRECNMYIEQIFKLNNKHLSLFKTLMRDIQNLLNIDTKNNISCYRLKEICRFQIRNYMRNQQYVLVQVEKQFHLPLELLDYIKCLQ